jgi:hypothetical protein
VPVNDSDAGPCYFRIVADYIHLNPARAGLAGGRQGPLVAYRWSSLPAYARGKGPEWIETRAPSLVVLAAAFGLQAGFIGMRVDLQ